MTGIIKRFNYHKGYGFIEPLVGRPGEVESLFFHISSVKGLPESVPEGAQVKFIVVRGKKGPQAANVELIELPARSVFTTPTRMQE